MQFSLFGAEAADPLVEDLDGVLLAGGDWVRTDGGAAARLSVLVAESWRAEALQAEFADRGLASDTAAAPGELIAVRTEITPRLGQQAQRWTRGANLRPPADLALSASGLRLWAVAAGRAEEGGYLLRMLDPDYLLHRAAGAQLARLGVTAVEVGGRTGTGWRVTSAKRLRRLAELIGAPPPGCGRDWPA
ncbi:hypothetical protein [Jatrophihabitans sp.]|uniref:hypothetical protein n=1 Tax=Jatrophihabitans sp. TaxID=1932789 RepID=UPI002C017487|nr:hypothetical protein [Jatrophihabitans sp.]